MPADLACKPCEGTGDELEDSMSVLGIPGGMVAVAPCPVCGGSGVAAWAVEAGALRIGVLLADTVALATGLPVVLMEVDDSMRSEATQMLAAVREEAKKQ